MSQSPADPTLLPADLRPVRFRLVHFLYATALLVSSVATFGGSGILPGILIVGAWAYIFASRSRPAALLNVFAVILIGLCLFGLLMPAIQTPREAGLRTHCRGNLKQIGLALHNYRDSHGSFPPAYIPDENGRPMHSWRVLILPYLDQAALYRTYDFDEPWDGPNNRKLLSDMPAEYACPEETHDGNGPGQYTSYVAVVGPQTSWPGPLGRKMSEFKHGTSNTILIIECNSGNIPWMEPRDLSFEEALRLLASSEQQTAGRHRREDFFYEYSDGRHILAADGSVRFLVHGVDQDVASALFIIDDGGDWPDSFVRSQSFATKKLKLGHCCRFAVFVLLVILPLPWVWLNPTSARGGPSEGVG